MSAELLMFPSHPVEAFSSSLSDMETFRMFLNERMAAAVEDILGVFGEAVSRYREQIDCQQRELQSLRSREVEWSHRAAGRFESAELPQTPKQQQINDLCIQIVVHGLFDPRATT